MENINRNIEHDTVVFDGWIKNLCENQKVADIDPELVKGVLESYGANFEISDSSKKSLSSYSNVNKSEGLSEVWGQKLDVFRNWVMSEYIPFVEKRVRKPLRTLWDKKTETYDENKHSGMMQFLGEITAFAAGEMSLKSIGDSQKIG